MSGKLGGITDLTGVRVGGAEATPGLSTSAASEGSPLIWCSFRTFSTPVSATANGSVLTTVAYPGVRAGDLVTAKVASSISSGVALVSSYVSVGAGSGQTVVLVYSNSSTAAATVVAHTVLVKVERFGTFGAQGVGA